MPSGRKGRDENARAVNVSRANPCRGTNTLKQAVELSRAKNEKRVCSHQKLAILLSTKTHASIHPKYHIFGVICLPASEEAIASRFNALL